MKAPNTTSRSLPTVIQGVDGATDQTLSITLPDGVFLAGPVNNLPPGASASIKGYAQSAPFAMGKFALRGLAQSMARELHPQGIHVAHVVIDGGIASDRRAEPMDRPASLLDPEAIAASYLHLIRQPRSAWSWEIEVRPWVEKF